MGFPSIHVTGHSFRRGAAQHAYDIGFTREQINRTRWTDTSHLPAPTNSSPSNKDGTTFISSSINLSGRSLAHPPISRSPRTVAPITSISS
ncbi:hypothetical protein E4U45_005461 [Claviceps purpurea]|nr:hypothetical protein E4U45_005461 [Claviceps purpurea]